MSGEENVQQQEKAPYTLPGYLIRKIAQQNSLRSQINLNYNEFRKKNMNLYIRKKTAFLREKGGFHMSYEQLAKNIPIFVNQKEDNNLKKKSEQMNKEQSELDKLIQKYTQDTEHQDDEKIQAKQQSKKEDKVDHKQSLKSLLNNFIETSTHENLFKQFKRQQLERQIEYLKFKGNDAWQIQKILQDPSLREFTREQMEQYFKQLHLNQNLSAGQLLQMDEVKYKNMGDLGFQRQPQKRSGVVGIQQFNEKIDQNNKKLQKQIIQMVKEAQQEPSSNMVDLKKKNQLNKKLQQTMDQEEHQFLRKVSTQDQIDPIKFYRQKQNFEKKTMLNYQKNKNKTHKINYSLGEPFFNQQMFEPDKDSQQKTQQTEQSSLDQIQEQQQPIQIQPEQRFIQRTIQQKQIQEKLQNLQTNNESSAIKVQEVYNQENENIDEQVIKSKLSLNQNYFLQSGIQFSKKQSKLNSRSNSSTTASQNIFPNKSSQFSFNSPNFQSQINSPKVGLNSQQKGFLSQQKIEFNNKVSKQNSQLNKSGSSQQIKETFKGKINKNKKNEIQNDYNVEKLKNIISRLERSDSDDRDQRLQFYQAKLVTKELQNKLETFLNQLETKLQIEERISQKIKLACKEIDHQFVQNLLQIEADNRRREYMPELQGEFMEFIKQQNFKKSFIQYMVEQVSNIDDVMSRYNDKKKMEQFFKSCLENFDSND